MEYLPTLNLHVRYPKRRIAVLHRVALLLGKVRPEWGYQFFRWFMQNLYWFEFRSGNDPWQREPPERRGR